MSSYFLAAGRSAGLAVFAFFGLVCLSAGPRARAEEAPRAVSYYHDVRPIIQERCQGCHQPAKAGGKVVLSSFAGMMEGKKGGGDPVIVPGKPEESILIEEISPDGNDPPSMPKEGEPLTAAQVETIRLWIAAGAEDDTPDEARDLYSMENPPVYERLPVLTSLDFSPDGALLAVSGYHEVLLQKSDGSGLVARLVGVSERIESVAFSPDGKSLAVTGGAPGMMGEVQIWDVEKRKLRLSLPLTYDTIFGVSWSPDGALVAFGCADNSVRAIEASSGKQVLFNGAHNDWVLGTAFSVDGSYLVSVSRDRSMKLIQVATEQFIDNITSITPGALKGGLMAVDRHPARDELLVGGADGEPKIYKMHREKARKIGDDYNLVRAFEPLPGRIFSTEFSGDGSRLVAASSSDGKGEVRVYQTDDAKLVWKLEVPTALYAVAYRPDAKVVAAGGFEGAVLLIDGDAGTIIKRFIPVPLTQLTRTF